jgi:hypothetical protein
MIPAHYIPSSHTDIGFSTHGFFAGARHGAIILPERIPVANVMPLKCPGVPMKLR